MRNDMCFPAIKVLLSQTRTRCIEHRTNGRRIGLSLLEV